VNWNSDTSGTEALRHCLTVGGLWPEQQTLVALHARIIGSSNQAYFHIMTAPYDIDSVLVERFAHGNGTVFVGAGISLGSRLPSWSELMGHLRTDLGTEISQSTDYLHIAELFETKHNRSVLVQYLKERLGDVRFQLTKTHELIVSLPVQRIYTTNFDTLLEQASQKKQINRNVIFNASHVGFSDTSTLSIVKLHGDLGDPNSIVISARDFYGYFARNPAVADLLKVELQTHTVLFLGYSFSDPNLGMILGNSAVQSGSSRPLLYSVQFKPSDLYVQAMHARGVKVISLDVNPGTPEADQAIEDWLKAFRQSLISFERRKNGPERVSKHLREPVLPLLRKNAIRRLKMSERIRAGLQSDFRVVVVKGEAGIGKTQLIAEAAADSLHAAGTFMPGDAFERVIWIKASFDVQRIGWVGHTLKGILDAIASNVETLTTSEGSDDLQKKRSDINMILQERRLLVVIEDLEDFDDLENPMTNEPGADPVSNNEKPVTSFVAIKEWLENAGPYANPMSRIIVTSRSAIVAGFVVEIAKLENKEATELLHDHARAIMLRRHCPKIDADLEKKLLGLTTGNPQAIKLALGLCNGTGDPVKVVEDLTEHFRNEHVTSAKIESVFKVLIDDILAALKKQFASAHEIVIAMTVFPTEEWVPAALVEHAVGNTIKAADESAPFTTLAERCVRFGLLEHNACSDKYLMPRIIKEVLIRDKANTPRMNAARERLADYLLGFLESNVCRTDIEEVYWNALVCDEMAKIDPYWQIIDVVMYWPEVGWRAVKFALLMVHYMDSRFLNNQRLKFIMLALKAPNDVDPRTRALLHIDALGWTFMEEGSNAKAREEIDKGLELLKQIDSGNSGDSDDLKALAYAWRARIDASEGKKVEASKNINLAFEYAGTQKKPWIMLRVEMMAGDVELMDEQARAAVDHYTKAAECAEEYGGEGDGYQTNPRIGLALLEVCDKHGKPDKDSMEKARRRFTQLIDNSHIPTGRLYGQYGMALIAARENLTGEARRQLQQIQKEIRHCSRGNVLLRLAEKSYEKIISTGKRRVD
jgi:tetratricopeptide (TPR) repeat protein